MSHAILPLLIVVAEASVVTLDTLRTIFICRGTKVWAAILGLVEIMIWLFAIGQIMQNLTDVWCFTAYAVGYTAGNFLGIAIEERLALGTLVVRIITNRDARNLIQAFRNNNYGVTWVEAHGLFGPVQVFFTIIPRRQLKAALHLIRLFDPSTFYSVEDIRTAAFYSSASVPESHLDSGAAFVTQYRFDTLPQSDKSMQSSAGESRTGALVQKHAC
jgi:uncharacterized protein YebE (UPF0316 family)